MSSQRCQPLISVMLAVPDAQTARAWYKRALGATELWNLGSVVGRDIDRAAIFLGEPEQNGWETPAEPCWPVHKRFCSRADHKGCNVQEIDSAIVGDADGCRISFGPPPMRGARMSLRQAYRLSVGAQGEG